MKAAAAGSRPVMVRFAGQRVVGVGGGPVAAAKLAGPLADGAAVTVIAPDAVPELTAAPGVTWHRRPYAGADDLDGAVLVVAATGDPAVDARVAADAAGRATLCVRADDGAGGSAAFAATVRRGPLTLAVSTDGQAPSLARHLRAELAATYGEEYGVLAALLGELRRDPAVRAHLGTLSDAGRRAAWRSIPVADILRLIRTGSPHSAKEVASACLSSSSG